MERKNLVVDKFSLITVTSFLFDALEKPRIQEDEEYREHDIGDGLPAGCVLPDKSDIITINPLNAPTLYKLITNQYVNVKKHELDTLLRDLYDIFIDESNDFTFDLGSLNGIKRKLIVIPKVSTNDTFRKIIPD